MKTLLLAAAVLSFGIGVARAETAPAAMHDRTMHHDSMHDGIRDRMNGTMAPKQTAHAVTNAWQSDAGLAGGGG